MKNRIIKLSLISIFSVAIIGCGGGGGGGGTASVSFPAHAVMAPADENTARSVGEIATNSGISGRGLSSVSGGGGNIEVNAGKAAHSLADLLVQQIKTKTLEQNYALNVVVDDNIPCDISGNAAVSGNVDGNNFNFDIMFNNCRNYGQAAPVNGAASTSGRLEGDEVKSVNFVITSRITASDYTMDVGSRFSIRYQVAGSVFSDATIEITATGTENGNKYGFQGARFVAKLLGNNDLSIYQTAGKMYIGADLAEYVAYDTSYDMSETPFVYASSDGQINDGGIAKYIAKDGDILSVQVEAGEVNVYKNEEVRVLVTL